MRVYQTKAFARFARRERIEISMLKDAIQRAEQGLLQASLASGLIKQRVARKGQGRSGGYRTIVAYRRGERAIFIYGFAKNERENIDSDELATFRDLSLALLAAKGDQIATLMANGDLEELFDEQDADEAEPPRD